MLNHKMDCDLRRIAECAICMGTFFDTRILICGHSFCLACLQKLPPSTSTSTVGITCPECRLEISLTAIGRTRNLSIEAFVKELNSTNATPATFPTSLPLCRGCCKRYPPQELKRCKDHDETCAVVALDDFATMKLKERSKKIARRKSKLHALQHDHVDCMQKILDEVLEFRSALWVVEDSLCVERNVFQPLIQQFSDMLTEFTELQAEIPAIVPLERSITELGILKAELGALQIEYPDSNPIQQKLKCINSLYAKLTETMRLAQEKMDQSCKILADLENVIQIGQGSPKHAFILMVSAAELLVSQRVQEFDDNLRTIRNYADAFQSLWSKYVETEPYFAPTVNAIKLVQTGQSTNTRAHAHSVKLKVLRIKLKTEDTTSNVLREKGSEIIAYVTEVVKTCTSVNEVPEIVMNALCAAKASFLISDWLIWTFKGCSYAWYHIDGAFTNGSHFAISCYNILLPDAAVVVPFLERKITQYSHLNDPCECICRDALQLFGEGKWSCIKGITGSVFIECSSGKQQIINITDRYYDYVIWVNY